MSEIDKDDWKITKAQLVETFKKKARALYPSPEPCECAPQEKANKVTERDIEDEIINVLEEDYPQQIAAAQLSFNPYNITPPYEARGAEVKQKAKDRELALRLLSTLTLTSYSEPNALSSVFREQVINLCKTQL